MQQYIDLANAAADLLSGGNDNGAIILSSYLTVPAHIEAALGEFASDPRADLFRATAPRALALYQGQLEQSAAREILVAVDFLTEMSTS